MNNIPSIKLESLPTGVYNQNHYTVKEYSGNIKLEDIDYSIKENNGASNNPFSESIILSKIMDKYAETKAKIKVSAASAKSLAKTKKIAL